MSKKKLLFFVNVDWFFVSHRLPLALKALEEGYEVHLLCGLTDQAEYLKSLGIIVHPVSLSRSGKNIFNEFAVLFKLYQKITRIKPDIVHLITIKPVLYGGLIARIARVPAVVSAVSGLGYLFVKREEKSSRLIRQLVLLLYRLAMNHPNQRVIFQNPGDRKALVDAVGLIPDKTCMIRGSGVNLNEYRMLQEPDGTPVIAMASRLLRDKGVCEFVGAAKIIQEKGVVAQFQLIGDPDPENPESVSDQIVEGWKSEGIIDCLGFRGDIAELFSCAHIVVLPSYREGLPKVLIEAAACGRAVVTTDVPGCRDAIEPNITGILVPVRDSSALAEAIERLIVDKPLRQQMGIAGRHLAEREFSIEKVVEAHFDIYRELNEVAVSS